MKSHFNRSLMIAAAALACVVAARPATAMSLEEQVRHELNMLPYYGVFDAIGYQVDGTAVTLSGAVHYPALADDAVNAVKHIAGISQVKNSIEVLPLSRFDDQLRLAAWREVYSWPGMHNLATMPLPPVRILVKNGNITLEGVVARQADKDALTVRLNTLPNVFSVTNDLVVETPQPHKS
jgi:hyperosmotically inducible protein